MSSNDESDKGIERDLGAYVSARLPDNVRATLLQLAKADKRSLSNYVRLVLEEHVEQQSEKASAEPAAA